MVTAFRPPTQSRTQFRLPRLPLLPRQSQELTTKVENIERRLTDLEHALKFKWNVGQISAELQQIRESIESPEVRGSGRYAELQAHLIGIAAAISIGLAIGNFSERTLNGVSTLFQGSVKIEQNFNTRSTEPPEFSRAPVVRGDFEKADNPVEQTLKKRSNLTEPSTNIERSVSIGSESGQGNSTRFDTQVTAIMRALVGQESGGNFSLVNPHSGAIGYLQLMPSNVGPWTTAALGYSLSPEQFRQSPKLQLKTGRFKIAQYLKQQSQPGRSEEEVVRRVASMWYSGQAKLWNSTKPQTYEGHSYPSIAQYTSSVYGKYRSELGKVQTASSLDTDNTEAKRDLNRGFWSEGLNKVRSRFQSAPTLKIPNTFQRSTTAAINPPQFKQDVLAQRIVAAMEKRGYKVARGEGEANIVYLRSSRVATNGWDAKRMVISFVDNQPKIVFSAEATSYPGDYYIFHGRADGGPFLKDGQYKAWQVGIHAGMTGRNPHEALVQAAALTVLRSHSHNFLSDGLPDTGIFGINLHGSRRTSDTVDAASAGCPVTRGMEPHREFMRVVKADPRYQSNSNFLFSATFINQGDI